MCVGIYTECHVTSHQTVRLNPFCYKNEFKELGGAQVSRYPQRGGCRGGLSEAPADPPQGTAEPLRRDSSASGKAHVRNDKTRPGSEGESLRNSLRAPR